MVPHVDVVTYPLNEDDEKPFQRVQNAVEVALVEMLFQLRKKLREDRVVVREEPRELRES